ncbi:MAG: response regulator [Leeuwenhoekiella sp.]
MLKVNLCVIFAFLQVFISPAQTEFNIRQISPPGGFTRHGIQSIAEDNLGYIWLGTEEGIIKFSSNHTEWFFPNNAVSENAPNAKVQAIHIAPSDMVWASTDKGLYQFNRITQNFDLTKYTREDGTDSAGNIRSVLQLNEKELLILDNNTLNVLDLELLKSSRVDQNIRSMPTVIYRDGDERVWIGTSAGGIYRYDRRTNTANKIISVGFRITCIYAQGKRLWVGTQDNGARIYGLNGKLIADLPLNINSGTNQSARVRAITRDLQGSLWFGTDAGLYVENNGKIEWIDPENYTGIPHNSIFELYEKRGGGLWIGTWSGGLALKHDNDNNFQTFRHNDKPNSISNNVVSSFIHQKEDELLIGTEVGGLNTFNISTEEFMTVPLGNAQYQVKNIKALSKDKEGGIWAGTFREGLWYRPADSSEFKQIKGTVAGGADLSSSSVYALQPVDSGVWIGVFDGGLNFYDFRTKKISQQFTEDINGVDFSQVDVQTIILGQDATLWVGTLDSFVYQIHLPTQTVKNISLQNHKHLDPNLTSYSLWQHKSGEIWIGTKNEGILIYNQKSDSIRRFDDAGLLKDKSVYGFVEDTLGKLWITSNNGLIVYDLNNHDKRQFVYSDGIQSNIFNPQALFKDDKGSLYFGGSHGFTRVVPSSIRKNTDPPQTTIKNINTANGQIVHPRFLMDGGTEPINLAPGENTFRINFFADNYLIPDKNAYKYRIANLNEDWIDLNNEGSVLFTGLDAGEYLFEVKAANNDGIWDKTPAQLLVIIDKYWYETGLAYFVYLLLVGILIYVIIRFSLERIKLKQAVSIEKKQRENEEQIHEMKLRFFTNISHEFRTPLSLILWPLRQLINSKNITSEDRTNLQIAQRSTNRLLEMINEIIDLRKLEKTENKLDISKFDLIQFIKAIHLGFAGSATSKAINFSFDTNYDSLNIEADEKKLDKVIYNLFSNAYKYVQVNGLIKVTVRKNEMPTTSTYSNQLNYGQIYTDDFVTIAIEDNGSGIDGEDLSRIFNRFEQGKREQNHDQNGITGSGIGLSLCKEFTLLHHGQIRVQSTVGIGTCFTLILPLQQKAQKILFESHQKIVNLKKNELPAAQTQVKVDPEFKAQILIVEDNEDYKNLLQDYLKKYYTVASAKNGIEALSVLKKRNIRLVISDVMMPDMDGFELCNIIKSQSETSQIPVILMTALSSSQNRLSGLDKGADAYLTKPIDELVLLKQIENLLKQRKRIEKNFSRPSLSQNRPKVNELDNHFLNRVRGVVEANLSDENFSVEKLAEEMAISRSSLHRKIKAFSGLSSSEFVNLVRIKLAIQMIEEENYLFREVYHRVGFSSQSYFTRCFKKFYDVSPKEYFKET